MMRIVAALLLGMVLIGCGGCSGSSGAESTPPPAAGTSYTITGSVHYEDVEYGPSGRTGNTRLKPVRRAVVELLDAAGGVPLATATTDEGGLFQLPTVTTVPVTIRIMAQATSASGTEVNVRSMVGGGRWSATYALAGRDLTLPQQIDIVGSASGTDIAGVFNMLDVFLSGQEYAASQFTPTNPLPALNIYWPNTYGSYTCAVQYQQVGCDYPGPAIYVLNDSSYNVFDQDHYDDDVLWHEFAHYLEYSLKVTDSPGGMHLFTDNTLDLTLAWSEGYADYFQTAVKRWLLANHPERLSIPPALPVSYYIDTLQDGTIYVTIDLANPGGTPYVYATSEVAVANVVWKSSESFGDTAIWSAWSSYMPGITYRARSLETFWDGLILQAGLTEGQLWPIFNGRLVNYSADALEADNSVGSRAVVVDCSAIGPCLSSEAHTHYLPSLMADVDIVPIQVSAGLTYTIATGNLTNGADTFLRLLDASGTVMKMADGVTEISNDDIPSVPCWNLTECNNGTNFSSRIAYTATADGILNVEVSNAPYASLIAGAYGGYTLTISAQ